LLDSSWTAKIADFGLSRLCSKEKQQELTLQVGTAAWMAPELMKKRDSTYTEQVDVYSFGIVAWELIAKDQPFKNLGFNHLIAEAVLSGERPIIPETCPKWFATLITRCWAQDPNQRPSFSELTEELEQQTQTQTSLLSEN
jgi:serine/threonine protein kinase